MRNFKSTGLPNTYNTPINTIDDIQFVVFELDGLGNIDFQVKGTVKNTTDINQIVEPLLLTDFNGGTAPTTFNDNDISIDFRTLTALPAGWVRIATNGTLTFNATTGLVLTNTVLGANRVQSNQDGSAFQIGAGPFNVSFVGTLINSVSSNHGFYITPTNQSVFVGIERVNNSTNWNVYTPTGRVITSTIADTAEHTFKIQRLANGNIQYYVDTTLIYTYTGVDTNIYTTLEFKLNDIGTQYMKSFSADSAGRVLLKADVRGLSSIILSGGVNTGVVGVNGYSE